MYETRKESVRLIRKMKINKKRLIKHFVHLVGEPSLRSIRSGQKNWDIVKFSKRKSRSLFSIENNRTKLLVKANETMQCNRPKKNHAALKSENNPNHDSTKGSLRTFAAIEIGFILLWYCFTEIFASVSVGLHIRLMKRTETLSLRCFVICCTLIIGFVMCTLFCSGAIVRLIERSCFVLTLRCDSSAWLFANSASSFEIVQCNIGCVMRRLRNMQHTDRADIWFTFHRASCWTHRQTQ